MEFTKRHNLNPVSGWPNPYKQSANIWGDIEHLRALHDIVARRFNHFDTSRETFMRPDHCEFLGCLDRGCIIPTSIRGCCETRLLPAQASPLGTCPNLLEFSQCGYGIRRAVFTGSGVIVATDGRSVRSPRRYFYALLPHTLQTIP